jgi:hypothetical protein
VRPCAVIVSLAVTAVVSSAFTEDPSRPPAGSAAVPVTAGHAARVDIAMQTGGSISGRLVDRKTGDPITNVPVAAFVSSTGAGDEVAPNSDGTFTLTGLAPSSRGYVVCALWPDQEVSPPVYAPQCFPHAYLGVYGGPEPLRVPPSATRIVLGRDRHKDIGDLGLTRGATIEGKVKTLSGKRLEGVQVIVRSLSDPYLVERFATNDRRTEGRYIADGLPPSAKGWAVCFDGTSTYSREFKGGGSSHHYLTECYRGRGWSGGTVPTKNITPVKVAAGAVKAGISGSLAVAGSITGRVDASNGKPVNDAMVHVLTPSGAEVGPGAFTDDHGRYRVFGLHVGRYLVCVRSNYDSGDHLATCFGQRLWRATSPPPAARRVPVQSHRTTTGIDIRMKKPAFILGRVTAATDGKPVSAQVIVFDAHGRIAGAGRSDHDGHFRMALPASAKGYQVCAETVHAQHHRATAAGCHGGGWWDGGFGARPSRAAPLVPLRAQHRKRDVDVVMPIAGRIAGTITVAQTGQPAAVQVQVLDDDGKLVAFNSSDAEGHYVIYGLRASSSGYRVCTAARMQGVVTHPAVSSVISTCYPDVEWSG